MKNWLPKKQTLIFFSLIVIICVIVYFASLTFVLYQIKKLTNYYSDTESQSSKEERVRVLRAFAETNKNDLKLIREFLVPKGDEVKFIEKIEGLAKKRGLEFEIVSIGVKSGDQNNFKEDVNVKMSVEGTWFGIISFVDDLEKMNFEVLVNNLSLDQKTGKIWSGNLDFVIYKEK